MVDVSWNPTRKAHVLTCHVTLPADRTAVFDFFSDAFRLEEITPPWLKFEVTTTAPIEITTGTLIDYRLKLRGLPIRWRTEITRWEPPQSFVDSQIRGPYRKWEHLHTFEEVDNGTQVNDEVTYHVPGSRLVSWLFVESQLKQIFEYRQKRMSEIFAGPQQSSATSAG